MGVALTTTTKKMTNIKQLLQQNQEQRITRILYFLNNPSEFHYFN